MANATNWPTWGGNFLSTLPPDLLLTIWANHPIVCQHINQNLDITFLNSLILKHASSHAMMQATGSSFFTQAMALATANTTSTALPELLAFMNSRLGQQRANALVQKVGHLLTLEQQYTLHETYLYGSSRLGVKNQQLNLSTRVASVQNGSLTPIGNAILNTDSVFTGTAAVYGLPKAPTARIFNRTWGLKQYELSNHLRNVQVTISDKKIGVLSSNQVDFVAYEPEVKSATDYYPGGMEMPKNRNDKEDNYRFSFNGFEYDSEVYNSNSFISWGNLGYDARLLKRFTVDLLSSKYPWQSPYSAHGNNSVLHKEIDGNDYAVYVNHSTKSIIIKATYYTTKGNIEDYNSALNAIKFWNNQSGKYQYKVGAGEEAKFYDINFELNVIEVDNPRVQANIDRLSDKFMPEGLKKITNDQSSNTYAVLPDADEIFQDGEEGKSTNGTTTDGAMISVKDSRKDTETGAHEVGHTLGLGHFLTGILTAASNDPNRSSSITSGYIEEMINNIFNRKSDKVGKGTLYETGTEPNKFSKGEVFEK